MKIISNLIGIAVKARSNVSYSFVTKADKSEPTLGYAGMHRYQTGGAVKLHTLAKKYTESRYRFNILYLVSSSLPMYPEKLIDKCKKKGIKVVWNQNGVGYPAWNKNYKELNSQMSFCMHKSDYVIYQSRFCKKSADKFLGKYNGSSSILYNPVDIKKFKPTKTKLSKANQITLLVMGSHHNKERVELAVKALKILNNKGIYAKMSVGGLLKWPNAKPVIKKGVTFLGFYAQNEAPMLYNKADILVHMKDKDSSPTVPLEAMACGLPVIGIKSGGMPELIDKNSGILLQVPITYGKLYYPTDEALANAILKVTKDLHKYKKGARTRALKHFSSKKWLKSHRRIFDKLLTG